MFTDTFFFSINYTRGNTCAQKWKNDIEWIMINPLSTKRNAHPSYKKLFKNNIVPTKIVMDGAREQAMGKFRRLVNMQ